MFLLSRSVKNITASWTALEEEKDDVEEEVVDRFRGRGAWRCLRVVLVLMPMSYRERKLSKLTCDEGQHGQLMEIHDKISKQL